MGMWPNVKTRNAQSDSEMVGISVNWSPKVGWCGDRKELLLKGKEELVWWVGSRIMQAGNGRARWVPAWFVLGTGGNWTGQVPLKSRGLYLAAELVLLLWDIPQIPATIGRTEWRRRPITWCYLGHNHLWLECQASDWENETQTWPHVPKPLGRRVDPVSKEDWTAPCCLHWCSCGCSACHSIES